MLLSRTGESDDGASTLVVELGTPDVGEAVGGQSEKTVSSACQMVVALDERVVVVLSEVEGVAANVEREGVTVHRTQLSGKPGGTCLFPSSV